MIVRPQQVMMTIVYWPWSDFGPIITHPDSGNRMQVIRETLSHFNQDL